MSVIPASGINFGFQVGDLVANAGSLVSSVGPYVLLGLAFLLAPKFIGLIKGVFRSRKAS